MSTQDPDQIRADIARTRAELSEDVDALTDRVSPSRVVHRQTDKVRSGVRGLRDRVMGTASDLSSSGSSAVHSVGDRASGVGHAVTDRVGDVGHAVTDLPQRARSGTQGSPLAAGLIAFGAGLVVAALMPSTEQEQRAATALKESAQPLADEVKSAASDVAQNLKDSASGGSA